MLAAAAGSKSAPIPPHPPVCRLDAPCMGHPIAQRRRPQLLPQSTPSVPRRGSSFANPVTMASHCARSVATSSASPAARSRVAPTRAECRFALHHNHGTPIQSASHVVVVPL
jgi:hypothetical protein